VSNASRKNGWQLSEIVGESTPYKLQQFIYRGSYSAAFIRAAILAAVRNLPSSIPCSTANLRSASTLQPAFGRSGSGGGAL